MVVVATAIAQLMDRLYYDSAVGQQYVPGYASARDSLLTVIREIDKKRQMEIRDSLRKKAFSVSTNLLWAGISTPNIKMEIPLGENVSLGVSGGLKPWPRWIPWEKDEYVPSKWRHFAIIPSVRWWPDEVFSGVFLETDLMYAHYNIGGITLPFGLYKILQEERLQGDFFGAGLAIGGAFWISPHWSLELSAGALAGYKFATRYECAWCGAEIGPANGFAWVPKLDISIAYHLFDEKRHSK